MGDRRSVSFAKKQKLEKVSDRIAFRPTEISMRCLASLIFQIDQECSEGIGNNRALRAQNAIRAYVPPGHLELFLEIRCVARLDLEEIQAFIGCDGMIKADRVFGA